MYHRMDLLASGLIRMSRRKEKENMSTALKRVMILAVIAIVAAVLGRLAVRAFLNLLLGGTLFGGNFL